MDELWMYTVKVIYWDDDSCKKKEAKLIVAAETMAESIKKVCSYYGDDRIESIGSTIIDESELGMILIKTIDAE